MAITSVAMIGKSVIRSPCWSIQLTRHRAVSFRVRSALMTTSATRRETDGPRVTYCFGGTVYVALTNESNAYTTMLAANGPGFTFPPGTFFEPLPDGWEPTGEVAAEAALDACCKLSLEEGASDDSNGGREVVFAGLGEPLLRLPALLGALEALRWRSEVRRTRLNTNGLVATERCEEVAWALREAGLNHVSVQLQTSNAEQHTDLVGPKSGFDFECVCGFVSALIRVGIPVVECTAVARPGVDINAARAFALGVLGAHSFKSRPFFP
eukprot:TRINITY_DN50488_c0_g1_i1.p1 TRINITY_DN50488_c0_g1~~TRINITY_DN50488_c0_g1_i1.p1  ORF type:complete len:283 (-),score=37.72 TRINITY_DN50488_c0_g1_i1:54-857(-)